MDIFPHPATCKTTTTLTSQVRCFLS
uniref:Uncharacterized protein n=1 Tax=Arundo donax TaxID=35708 RepID=A0A0A9HXD3_ARUDO